MTAGHEEASPKVKLGTFDIGCVVVGGIIGVGIFFTPQRVALACGSSAQVMAAWLLGGTIAVLGALVFARLALRVRDPGGMFAYVHDGFGALPAFLYGWSNWLVIQAGALGVIGLVMVDYADRLVFGEAHTPAAAKVWIAAGSILMFTVLNVLGLRVGKAVQNLLTVLKTVAVGGLVVVALLVAGDDGSRSESAGAGVDGSIGWFEALSAAMLPVLFSFGGWQQGSFVAATARTPRSVSLGILGGVGVVVVAYLGVNLAFLDLLGFAGARESTAIGADAARAALGEVGERVFAGMVVLSALGILNTICLAPPYVLHAMAQRGLFFSAVGRLHPRYGTPALGIVCQGGWAVCLLVVSQLVLGEDLGFLLNGVVFVDWLFFSLCGLAVLIRARQLAERSISGVFTVLALAVMVGAISVSPVASLAGLGVTLLGLLGFALLRSRSAGRSA